MIISSSNFQDGQAIPKACTCQGENRAPDLMIGQVPDDALSLALVMDDPDSPSKKWVHWIAWNIPPTCGSISDGRLPAEAIQGTNDFMKIGYGGPCPHQGLHHYHFTLYALDAILELAEGATLRDLEEAMFDHILDKALLIGTYRMEN